MTKQTIEIDDILIEVQRKPIKNLHLRIYPPFGQVKVSAPLQFSTENIFHFIKKKLNWIKTHQPLLLKPVQQFTTGFPINFLGKTYTLAIENNKKRFHLALDGDWLRFEQRATTTVEQQQKALQNWYRMQMKALLPSLIARWELILGVSPSSWGIKIMKTRWGSCNIRARRIWLNLNLIEKPLACIEYVLVHEMIHLLEARHNKRFYALMDRFLPDWTRRKNLLGSG
jgi:predicted metal-dependent hydrolase